ncbi:CRISPR-associated helicase Cas3' [Sedimenticola hydrogenitrophicus]|uniref:CRISPR-associated helicase Cas3' n=1 Tax=Sedimenticola hydrogenitrophicus TaxID=2967975 RepID=UPI0023AEBA85|nr:CRISPR-associated helicase Cas3' [Sedimenticola hydrogenitrophicus]
MEQVKPLYYRYWGKTAEEGGYHLLPYHCLDVAAVGEVFLRRNVHVRQRLAQLLGLDEEALIVLVVFFLGLHDIGKFARHFQALNPELFQALQGEKAELPYVRHDILGELLWRTYLRPYCVERGVLEVQGGRRPSFDTAADYWLHTVLGHHGKPVSHDDSSVRAVPADYFPVTTQEAVKAFFEQWHDLCKVGEVVLPLPDRVSAASWWLAGLAVLCDWLGSNQAFFPPVSDEMALDEYWQQALRQAEQAVVDAGMVPAETAERRELPTLFGGDFREPTPLQAHCLQMPLEAGAGLYLLEDVTGAGKTEAALILVHRLMAEQVQQGVYFALPTMATANAMFDRMSAVYRGLYADETKPSLVLAHGARRLHEGFRDAIGKVPEAHAGNYGDGTEPAEFHCAAWLADSPKKSLLAEVGVGTVDQAVLGVLPSRHQSLRLFGLLGKVLIIDEVHAYEAYLFRLLCALITFHAASGGSTILLSATLPHGQRQKLLNAYYTGIGKAAKKIEKVGDKDYPLLTCATPLDKSESVLDSRKEVCRTVGVSRINTFEQAEALMQEAVSQGKCLCWIRNTVHDAREAWREIKVLHPDWDIDLFHARFAMGDRLTIEKRVVNRFGTKGDGAERKGQILIATPVVEQSLDIDFDGMISDLAPIDLIIQRAGRLHRHSRDRTGRRIKGKDQRDRPVIYLFAPEAVDEPDREWFANFLSKAAYVYDNHAQLWLGLRLLCNKGAFTMPDDARVLIEGVYGDVELPPGLEESYIESEGVQSSEGSLADYNALKVNLHYGETAGGRWWAEERAPTRLGDSTTVYLGRIDGESIVPLRGPGDFPWHLSSVSVLTSRIASANRPAGISEKEWKRTVEQLPAKGKWGVLLALDEKLEGVAVNKRGEAVAVRYSEKEGLLVGDECGD